MVASVHPDRVAVLARRSHAVITSCQDPGGAYPASPTFSAYRGYAWLRDGAFIGDGVSRFGDVPSVNRFHDWVTGVLEPRADHVRQLVEQARAGLAIGFDEMLPTRYRLTGQTGSDPWWNFQTDGYGAWLWSVVTHAHRHGQDLERWRPGIEVAVDYLTTFWDRPCYDWWEEHVEHRHVSTLAAIHGGLTCAADSGVLDPQRQATARQAAAAARHLVLSEGTTRGPQGSQATHLSKWLGSDAVDGSLPAAIVPFGLLPPDSALARATLEAVQRDLDAEGGVHRFRADVFYGGGQWPLLSCLLGWNLAALDEHDAALRYLAWAGEHADTNDDLPEQVPDHLLHPDSRPEWIKRWGTVATPLLWSHGMYLILADELGLLPERP